MRRNLIPLMGIALVVAIAATGIFYGLFVGKMSGASSDRLPRVVVAARDLQPGMLLQPEDLRTEAWTAPVPADAFHNAPDAAGRSVSEIIRAGEPVVQARLSSAERVTNGSIPAGMRGISLRILDSSGLFASLRPGMKVDIQVVRTDSQSGPAANTILQNVPFLGLQGEPPQPGSHAIANLLVTPEDADRLALAEAAARIRLLLRNQAEPAAAARPAVTLSTLSNAPASVPVAGRSAAPSAGDAATRAANLQLSLAWLPAEAANESPSPEASLHFGIVDQNSPLAAALRGVAGLAGKTVTPGAPARILYQTIGSSAETPQLIVRARTENDPSGIRLNLQAEVTAPTPGGWSSRTYPKVLALRPGQSILLTGWDDEKTFPGIASLLTAASKRPAGTRPALVVSIASSPGASHLAAVR